MLDVQAYKGLWYELAHSPSWFQHNDDYNTTALYTMMSNGDLKVVNTTINKGKRVSVEGVAVYCGKNEFIVSFSKGRNGSLLPIVDNTVPNYCVSTTWRDKGAVQYKYAIVTNPSDDSIYLLSRTPRPTVEDYSMLMDYINFQPFNEITSPQNKVKRSSHIRISNIVQTPHYC